MTEAYNNIFGDDGFRCKYGEKYLTKKFLISFSRSLSKFYTKKYKNPRCIIGIDTRFTGPKIYKIIASELIQHKIEVHYCGVIPSPGISFTLKKFNFHFGIMITASHNSYHDNGIKLFNSRGFKLSPREEKKIEESIKKILMQKKFAPSQKLKNIKLPPQESIYIKTYTEFLKKIVGSLKFKSKFIIDCSNGASSSIMSELFNSNKNILVINNKPNGKNINLNCGSLHPEKLQKKIIKNKFNYGIALDGDSDRCILVDRKTSLVESEKVLFMILKIINNIDKNYTVCSSEIVNKALEYNLRELKYRLFQTNVGDRNVINTTKKRNAILGFEPSGHFYYPKLNNSMDGNITLVFILKFFEKDISKFKSINKLENYKRVIENIPISNIRDNFEIIKKKINKFPLTKYEKLLVRQSIWDPVYRVYYDFKYKNRFDEIKLYIFD